MHCMQHGPSRHAARAVPSHASVSAPSSTKQLASSKTGQSSIQDRVVGAPCGSTDARPSEELQKWGWGKLEGQVGLRLLTSLDIYWVGDCHLSICKFSSLPFGLAVGQNGAAQ